MELNPTEQPVATVAARPSPGPSGNVV